MPRPLATRPKAKPKGFKANAKILALRPRPNIPVYLMYLQQQLTKTVVYMQTCSTQMRVIM